MADGLWGDVERARQSAEEFRQAHLVGTIAEGAFPIDTVFIADNILRLDLIPFPGLERLIDSAAAITPEMSLIYVDEALFSSYDDPRERQWRKDRLRFSVAHELGHIWMHKEFVPLLRCKKVEDLKAIFNQNDSFKYALEKEANEFAGRLIVPYEKLKECVVRFGNIQTDPHWRKDARLRAAFCEKTSPHFGINAEGLRTRLDRESLWPSDWTVGG